MIHVFLQKIFLYQCCTACSGSLSHGTYPGFAKAKTALEPQTLLDANTGMDTFGALIYQHW